MLEVWKLASGSDVYEVSNLGRVRRAGRLLSPRLRKGYLAAHFSERGVKRNAPIHILVCEAFNGPRPDMHVAAHSDGDPLNNRADNLRWATISENVLDRYQHGNPPSGEGNANSKLTSEDVSFIRETALSVPKLALRFGVSETQIWRIRTGRSWAERAA